MDVKDLQHKQAEYDKHYWERKESELEKIRHITLHVGKLLGKLSTYCERQEHGENYPTAQIKDEVVADMMVHSLQLANLLGVDVGERYVSRLEENIKRLYKK